MQPQRYLPKKISEVKRTDSRVSVMGTVFSAGENVFGIEDSSGKTEIFSEFPAKVGDLVRVFCTTVDGRLKADAVQSLNGLDLNLYQKVQELYRKVGV